MRFMAVALAALALVACSQQTPPPAGSEAPQRATFEDNGCIGALLAHRAVVIQGSVDGDAAALTAALESWRIAARQTLSADELAQFEASSFAVEQNADAEERAAQAASCVANAPAN